MWSGILISFKHFPQFVVIHTVKGFCIVNEAEVGIFWNSLLSLYPVNVGNWISGFSAFSKPSWYIWKFLIQVLLKAILKNLSITLLAWERSATVR